MMEEYEMDEMLEEQGIEFYFNENYPQELSNLRDIHFLPKENIVFDTQHILEDNEISLLDLLEIIVYQPENKKEAQSFIERHYGISNKQNGSSRWDN